jgi:hypothetical protein
MRVDRGVRRPAVVLAALLAATTPVFAVLATPAAPASAAQSGLRQYDPLTQPEPVTDAELASALAFT